MQIQTAPRYHFSLIRLAKIQKFGNSPYWEGCREAGTLLQRADGNPEMVLLGVGEAELFFSLQFWRLNPGLRHGIQAVYQGAHPQKYSSQMLLGQQKAPNCGLICNSNHLESVRDTHVQRAVLTTPERTWWLQWNPGRSPWSWLTGPGGWGRGWQWRKQDIGKCDYTLVQGKSQVACMQAKVLCFILFLGMCVCVCLCKGMCKGKCVSVLAGQERVSDHLGLEL